MKRLLCLLAFGWLLGLSTTALAADAHVALVKRVEGSVKVVRASGSVEASGGTQLLVSDRLIAAPGATASIVFRDGTLLTLGSGADVLVRDYLFEPKDDAFSVSLYLNKGSAIYESGKIGKLKPEAVKIDTPTATVGVRGTRLLIEAN